MEEKKIAREQQLQKAAIDSYNHLLEESIDDNIYIKGFKAGANWDHKHLMNQVCKYLKVHCDEVKTEDNGIAGWIDEEFINNLRENVGGQSKVWLNEDLKMVFTIISIFEVNHPDSFFKTSDNQVIYSSEVIKWLKSLKDRIV